MKIKKEELERNCRTCENAEYLVDKDYVLCKKKGIISAGEVCGKFIYDALKHEVPKKAEPPKLDYIDIDK